MQLLCRQLSFSSRMSLKAAMEPFVWQCWRSCLQIKQIWVKIPSDAPPCLQRSFKRTVFRRVHKARFKQAINSNFMHDLLGLISVMNNHRFRCYHIFPFLGPCKIQLSAFFLCQILCINLFTPLFFQIHCKNLFTQQRFTRRKWKQSRSKRKRWWPRRCWHE